MDIWTSDVGMEYKTSGWGYNEDPYKISNVLPKKEVIKMDSLSRVESILQSKLDGTAYRFEPQSRIELLLMQLNVGGGGGSGGDTSYLAQQVKTLQSKVSNLEIRTEELESHAIQDNILEGD